jgi:hypothetical protein
MESEVRIELSSLSGVIIVRSYEVLQLQQDCVTSNFSSSWWISNKSIDLIWNSLIICRVTRSHDNIIRNPKHSMVKTALLI